MVKFCVLSAPVTEDVILKKRKVAAFSAGIAYLSLAAIFASLIALIVTENTLFAISVLLGLIAVFGWRVTSSNDYAELPEDECGKMLALCEATEEGRQYRQAVLTQGRKFVVGELSMMGAWVENISNRANCKKLYGVASASDTLSNDAR